MWIELPDEIIEYTRINDDPCNRLNLTINSLILSMIKHQHIVFMSRKLLDHLDKMNWIWDSNKVWINWLKRKYIYAYEGSDIIEFKIIVSIKDKQMKYDNKVFFVPYLYFYEIEKTNFLTENETDFLLFINIYHQIKKGKKLNHIYDISIDNDSCHGANAHAKLKCISKKQKIVLCILDSDKRYAEGKKGSTYKGANDVYKQIKKKNIIYLQALNVREKENLFSPNFYLQVCGEDVGLLKVLNDNLHKPDVLRYFDIKDGVKLKDFRDDRWKRNYIDVINQCKRIGIYIDSDKKNDEFVCIKGIGSKVCQQTNMIFLGSEEDCEKEISSSGKKYDDDKREEIYNIRKDVIKQLPEYLVIEWEWIHNLVFSWGCCFKEDYKPIGNY